jgi:glycosyltransferase involved in cell wall biosynthesis
VIRSLACVIPALDAAGTLPGVVAGVRRALPGAHVIVVDDGSSDGTRRAAAALADAVIGFERNLGKGAALRTGFEAALRRGSDAVLTVDADGQHDTSRAPSLVAALARADVVVGARERARTAMPIHRRMSNALSSAAISRCAGCSLPDTQSGYRAISAAVLERVRPDGDRYEFETDFLIRAARAGFRIECVPVPTIYGAPSHFRELRDALRVIGTIYRHTTWRPPTRAGL